MIRLSPRDLAALVASHFRGTPGERLILALRLGEESLRLYLANSPAGASAAEAREALSRANRFGRQPSAVAGTPLGPR